MLGLLAARCKQNLVVARGKASFRPVERRRGKTECSVQDTGERQALLANIFFAAGAASIITGIILIFVEDTGPEVETGNTDVSLIPRVSRDGAGISFGIGF